MMPADARDPDALMRDALTLHRSGNVAGAAAIYRRLLARHPGQAQLLSLLGTAECQQGNLAEGERALAEAVRLAPASAEARYDRGKALFQLGRLEEALASFDAALRFDPKRAEAHANRGIALQGLGRAEDALASFDRAIGLKPDWADAHFNRGNALRDLSRVGDALASYDRALALRRDFVNAWVNHGNALRALGRFEEALASCDHAIRLAPGHAVAHNNRGNVLRELGRANEALASYDRALALQPAYAEAHANRGSALSDLGRLDAALASHDRALQLAPAYAEAHTNRGVALHDLRRLDEALASHERAIGLKPDYAEAHYNRGVVLYELQRLDDALASFDRAGALDPDCAKAHWNAALLLLLRGDYGEGWKRHEWRWKRGAMRRARRAFPQPLWLGEPSIGGRTILIHAEQGLGDVIQFCRYVPQVAGLGGRVVFEVPAALATLVATLDCDCMIVEQGTPLPPFDVHCPLMSLPLALGTTLETIPAVVPYLAADPERVRHWRRRLGPQTGLRVGLVWSGGFRPDQPEVRGVNERRNIPLAQLELLNLPNVEFVSLQKGADAVAQLRQLEAAAWHGPAIADFTSELEDFADTAALVECLDVVVGVDTSTAHLAGALGKPTWILNRFDTCWRWLQDRADSPWYPTVTLFRQRTYNDWAPVVADVREQLDLLAQRRGFR